LSSCVTGGFSRRTWLHGVSQSPSLDIERSSKENLDSSNGISERYEWEPFLTDDRSTSSFQNVLFQTLKTVDSVQNNSHVIRTRQHQNHLHLDQYFCCFCFVVFLLHVFFLPSFLCWTLDVAQSSRKEVASVVFPSNVTWPVSTSSKLSSVGYHVIVTNNIRVNRLVRRLEGNIGKYNGGGRGRCREGLTVGLLSVASV
jgi:hypothetical protein